MLENKIWDYKIGDLVYHKTLGSGLVISRSTMSFHEMARPIRIVDREMYTVCFGASESTQTVRGDSLLAKSLD